MKKLTFDEALQGIADDRPVSRDDVLASALRRTIWTYMSCFPGCMPEYQGIATSKEFAIDSLEYVVGAQDELVPGERDPSRGWKTSLRKFHGFYDGRMNYTIEKLVLADVLES